VLKSTRTTLGAPALSAPEAARIGEEQSPASDWFQTEVKPYLTPDGRRRPGGRLVWHEWMPGVIRTTDRRYAIVRVFIPGKDGAEDVYLLREGHFSTDCWGPNHLGTTAGDSPRIDFALNEAEIRAWCADIGAGRDVPAELADALAYVTFIPPAERTPSRDGLAVERDDDGTTWVRIYSMKRSDGDGTEPYVLAELNITDLVGQADARPEARREMVERIMLAAGEPYTVGHVMDRLGAAVGVFPRDSDRRRQAVEEILAEMLDDGWAELDRADRYQIAETYRPPAVDPDSGAAMIREVIRKTMLRLNTVPVHRVDIVAQVASELRDRAFFPSPEYVESIIDQMVEERFLGDTGLATYTVTSAARRHYELEERKPRKELPDLGTTEASQHACRFRLREAILTTLLARRAKDGDAPYDAEAGPQRPGRMTIAGLVAEVESLLEARDDVGVNERTIHNVLAEMLNEGTLNQPERGQVQLPESTAREWLTADLNPYEDRLARIDADVLELVTRRPGRTFEQITMDGTRFGGITDSEGALRRLIENGKVRATEDGRHYNAKEILQ
jgi:hypothetical protein